MLGCHVEDAEECAYEPDAEQRRIDLVEREAVEAVQAIWLDTWASFCNERCSVLAGNVLLWRDKAGHLTPALLAPRLRELLADLPERLTVSCRC